MYRKIGTLLFFFARVLTRRGSMLGQWLHNKGMLFMVKGYKKR